MGLKPLKQLISYNLLINIVSSECSAKYIILKRTMENKQVSARCNLAPVQNTRYKGLIFNFEQTLGLLFGLFSFYR